MQHIIKTLLPKKLAGKRQMMSYVQNTTPQLWGSFMPQRKLISNAVGNDLYSVQIYAPDFFHHFDASALFEKWAAVEVTDHDELPEGMEAFFLPGGLYAVFYYKGDGSDAPVVFRYILTEWLPASGYVLDDRPHFEILGEKYKRNDPASEETIWIPVREKL